MRILCLLLLVVMALFWTCSGFLNDSHLRPIPDYANMTDGATEK